MRNLVIMPAMAQNRERMNLGEYAEEETISACSLSNNQASPAGDRKKSPLSPASSEYRVVILPNMVNGNRFAVWFNGS